MALPHWKEFQLPILKILSDGLVRDRAQIIRKIPDTMKLSSEERRETFKSGDFVYRHRGNWALQKMCEAGLVDERSGDAYAISNAGKSVLRKGELPEPGVKESMETSVDDGDSVPANKPSSTVTPAPKPSARTAPVKQSKSETDLSPIDQVERGIHRVNRALEKKLLKLLLESEPEFFEKIVLDLLIGMGYGGPDGKAIETPASNDGGIDGIINQDSLGLSRIYVQAKRWKPGNNVSRPEVQKFFGALHTSRAQKGVFITTADFSEGAQKYAADCNPRIVLVNGEKMARLMVEYKVGVSVTHTYDIAEIDEDYFE
ncbi:MAG: restriction endonuclease [Lawsonella sp.]